MMCSEAWRLLVDGGAPGARNMAIDEALLEALVEQPDSARHTLRLYWFDPPAVSIGAFQPLEDIDLAACAGAGIDVVRRPSGGRAVLHDGCLTYALIGPAAGDVFAGGSAASYARVGAALIAAIGALGVPQVTAAPRGRRHADPSCFAVAAPHEPVVAAGKLAGSAQLRRGAAVLQHGSLRLAPGRTPISALLRPRQQDSCRRPPEPPTVSRAAGREVGRAEAANAFVAAFAETFSVRFVPGSLTPAEAATATALERARYRELIRVGSSARRSPVGWPE